jgi:two-component system, NarL family, sensor kinase
MFRSKGSDDDAEYVDLGAPNATASLGRLVLGVWIASLVAIVTVSVLHVWIMRRELREHETQRAVNDVRDRVDLTIEHDVTEALIAGDPDAMADFDAVVQEHIVRPTTAGLALWTKEGRIAYSLDPTFVGDGYDLPAEVVAALDTMQVQTGDGHDDDERTPEPGWKSESAIEVYAPFVTTWGERMVWEVGLERDEVSQQANSLVIIVALLSALGAGLLLTTQGVMGRTLVQRHDRERAYRRWLTQRTAEMAVVERRQIAADLHDGVVQELAGIALDLEAPIDGDGSTMSKDERAEFARRVRNTVATLRGQTAELYPTTSALMDVPTALAGMLARTPRGLTTSLHVDDGAEVAPPYRWLVFRVAQEALRNVVQHSKAPEVRVELRRTESGTVLVVEDNGIGFDPAIDAAEPGHMGLSLLSDMATAAGTSLSIRSARGQGTTVRLEVPQ